MRLLIVTVSLLLLATASSTAQTTLNIKMQVGHAWQNSSSDILSFIREDEPFLHYGLSAEVFRAVSHKLALGIAPGYMRRGTDFEFGFINGLVIGPIPTFDAQLHLNYLQLPILIKYETPLLKKLTLNLQTGAGFAYLLSGFREARLFGSDMPTERRSLDFSGTDEEINRFDFGSTSSLGVGYPLPKGKIQLSFDYYHSFMDADQKVDSQNRTWAVGLGYQFVISKTVENTVN
ncbi:MAG: porin family protein [Bacteroidota bacterium]